MNITLEPLDISNPISIHERLITYYSETTRNMSMQLLYTMRNNWSHTMTDLTDSLSILKKEGRMTFTFGNLFSLENSCKEGKYRLLNITKYATKEQTVMRRVRYHIIHDLPLGQKRIYDTILGYLTACGKYPTVEDIANHLYLSNIHVTAQCMHLYKLSLIDDIFSNGTKEQIPEKYIHIPSSQRLPISVFDREGGSIIGTVH